jgi:HEAT repeat protein
MPVSMEQVRAHLDRDEPDYPAAAQLGPEALPQLRQLAQGDDPMLASKAVYLASLIGTDQSVAIVNEAAARPDPVVRAAAAGAVRNLDQAPNQLLNSLLGDQDAGVRKVALRSVEASRPTLPADVATNVRDMAVNAPNPQLRQLAGGVIDRLPEE